MDKILIIGAHGQLASAFKNILGENCLSLSRNELDLANQDQIIKILSNYQFNYLINTAAYTLVDEAEDNQSLSYKINAYAPIEIAKYCLNLNIPFVHYSTDYVFDGSKDGYLTENDPVNPLSIYGKSKLMGEENIQKIGSKYLIFRTSWLYDHKGKNFLNTMLKLGLTNNIIKVVKDQYSSPTYATDLALNSLIALKNIAHMSSFPSGIYHLTNNGATSWYGFAEKIFEIARNRNMPLKLQELVAISGKEFITKAARPTNSKLCNKKIKNLLGIEMRNWLDALKECMSEK